MRHSAPALTISLFSRLILPQVLALFLLLPGQLWAGTYTQSAHGDMSDGVDRTSISGYSIGNCSHCHEQHGLMGGEEPDPVEGGHSVYALFANSFSSLTLSGPYNQSDNFCFYCHISTGGLQSGGGITNHQYSNVFAGYPTASASGIMEAFNLNSYHNLYDIHTFAESRFDFFSQWSNPCSACHNPHLAKRNHASPTDPSFSAISLPSAHDELWGDDPGERMSDYTANYRAPYYYGSTTTHEPGGTAANDGSLMPDYNSFCLDCHQYEVPVTKPGVVSMNPATTPGHLTAIDWGASGDMHGGRQRYWDINGNPKGFGTVTAPYNVAPVLSNYVTSCIDCHEPHGSVLYTTSRSSTYLLRKEVNNTVVGGCGPASPQYFCENNFCYSCHTSSHCGGPQGCFVCHYHGAQNQNCGAWTGANF